MIVQATRYGFYVTDADNTEDFHVAVGDLTHDEFVLAVMASADVSPHAKPRHLWISTDFLRKSDAISVDPKRAARLEKMLKLAAEQGWLSADGCQIAGHVVVPEAD